MQGYICNSLRFWRSSVVTFGYITTGSLQLAYYLRKFCKDSLLIMHHSRQNTNWKHSKILFFQWTRVLNSTSYKMMLQESQKGYLIHKVYNKTAFIKNTRKFYEQGHSQGLKLTFFARVTTYYTQNYLS